jgi:hypothetical protein
MAPAPWRAEAVPVNQVGTPDHSRDGMFHHGQHEGAPDLL